MIDLLIKSGLKAFKQGKCEEALKYFHKLKNEKKDYYLGLTYVKLKDYDSAIRHLRLYLRRETNYELMIQVYMVLGYVYALKLEYVKSRRFFEKSLQLDFYNSKAYAALGYLDYKMNNYQESVKKLKKAIEFDNKNANAHNSLGYIYGDMNLNMADALKECEIALLLSPDYPAYLDSLGWVYYKQGDLIRAKQYLTQALDKLPESDEIRKHFKTIIVREINKKHEKID